MQFSPFCETVSRSFTKLTTDQCCTRLCLKQAPMWWLHVCWPLMLKENRADNELANRNNGHWLSSMGAAAGKYNRQVPLFAGYFVLGLYVCTQAWNVTVTCSHVTVSQGDSDVLVGRFNYEPKHDFSLWTLEQPTLELNRSHPNIRGISWKTSAAR